MPYRRAGPGRKATLGFATVLFFILGVAAPHAGAQETTDPGTHFWVNAGGGIGTAGWAGTLGAGIERSEWVGTVRYLRAQWNSNEGRGSMLRTFTDEYALLLSRTVRSGTSSTDLGVGLAYVSRLEQGVVRCGSDCIFGRGMRSTGSEGSGPSLGLAFDATVRGSKGGRFGIGFQLLGTVSQTGSHATAAMVFDLGRLR